MFTKKAVCVLVMLTCLPIFCSRKEPLPITTSPGELSPADQYLTKAEKFFEYAKYDTAIFYFDQARLNYDKVIAQRPAAEFWEKQIKCLNKLGECLRLKYEFKQARLTLNNAIVLARTYLGESHPCVAEGLANLAMVDFDQDRYSHAISKLMQALDISLGSVGEKHLVTAKIYYGLGVVNWRLQHHDLALDYQKKALNIRRQILGGLHPDVAESYRMVGRVYWYKSDFDQSISFLNKALSAAFELWGEKHPLVARIYLNFASNHINKKEYEEAHDYLRKASDIGLSLWGGNHLDTANMLYLFGLCYLETGKYEKALSYLEKSLDIRRQILGHIHYEVAASYVTLGWLHQARGNLDAALAYHKEALQISLTIFDKGHPWSAGRSRNIGTFYFEKGDYDEALDYYQRALTLLIPDFTPKNVYMNPTLDNIRREGSLIAILRHKAEALKKRYDSQSQDIKDLETSLATYRLASEFIDKMRSTVKSEGSKLTVGKITFQIYGKAVESALQLYEVTQNQEYKHSAFFFAEKSKSAVLLQSLVDVDAKHIAGIPAGLLQEEKRLREEMAENEKIRIELTTKGDTASTNRLVLVKDKEFRLRRDLDALNESFERDYPNYYSLKHNVRTVSVIDVQKQILGGNSMMVEYLVGEKYIFIFTITSDDIEVTKVERNYLIEKWIEQLRSGIVAKDDAAYTHSAYRLYEVLLNPVADRLAVKNLIIIADGILNHIPFEVLLTEPVSLDAGLMRYSELSYLVKKHAISYAYSATLLHATMTRQREQAKRDFLAFAPVFPSGIASGTRSSDFFYDNVSHDSLSTAKRITGHLSASKTEVTEILNRFNSNYGFIGRLLGRKARTFLGSDASEQKLKMLDLSEYRYLHFATHGFANEDNPILSGLLFAQTRNSKEDGILHLGEIYNLRLNTELAVLSACETALGKFVAGEGIIGLTRAFLYAGAANLLVSLWQVSDVTTADLMVDFYDRMLSGMSKSEALREAKLQLIQSHPEYAKPYYWSPFILIGW